MLDVAVIGAGPAGNGVALGLARAGWATAVVDYRSTPGDKLCTGIVSARCLEEFPATRPVILRCGQSATVVSPGGKPLRFQRDQPHAYIIDRVSYVRDLADQAAQAGAEYHLGWTVTDLCPGPAGVSLTLERQGCRRVMEARAAVIASGFSPLLTSRAGLGKVHDFAVGAQVEVLAPDVDEVRVFLGSAYAPGFFAWLAPTSHGKALLGLLSRRGAQAGLDHLLADLRQSGTVVDVVGRQRRWGIPLRPLPKTVAGRLLVVGDAAGQVKPTTGGGIYYALLAGRIAAEVLSAALARGDLSEAALLPYDRRWSALLADELAIGSRLRAIGERLTDRQIEQALGLIGANSLLRRLLSSVDASFDWHGKLAHRLVDVVGMDFRRAIGAPDLWRRLSRQGSAAS